MFLPKGALQIMHDGEREGVGLRFRCTCGARRKEAICCFLSAKKKKEQGQQWGCSDGVASHTL